MQNQINGLNPTIRAIYAFLQKELAQGPRYISYYEIGRRITPPRSWNSVSYSVNKLISHGLLFIRDGKLSLK